ncbi:MAG: creatininase family protein, partial [Actinomycetia bacterium]|nr:creatininase family protein [Actinomycetes bacterium]
MKEFLKLTKPQYDNLDREKTLFLSVMSPVEVHGTHLPNGTDIFIAREVMTRFVSGLSSVPKFKNEDSEKITESFFAFGKFIPEIRELIPIQLPELPVGAQPQPVSGSIPVKWRTLRDILISWGEKLASDGFKYWMIFDNHGGFTHQLAQRAASIKLQKKHDFFLLIPFLQIMKD